MHQLSDERLSVLFDDARALLKQLIVVPSYSKEEEGTATIIEQFFSAKGIKASRLRNNVWAANKHFDSSKPTILLNSHHDTVMPNKDYTRDPFDASESDGKIFGLGSNDAGGCLVALIAAFVHYYDTTDLKCNIIIAASAEEEISGANGIEALLPQLGAIDFAIVGEPTLMQMAVAEKGLMVLDCAVMGRSGHAARDEGDNAIYKALPCIEWFRTYQFPKVSDMLGPVKMSVTMVQAGTQHNVVPASCSFTVDVRINDSYTHEELLSEIRRNVLCDVQPRSVRLRSTSIVQDHPIVEAGGSLGIRAFGSSTLSDKALMPFPALKMGPGDSARSHMADEFIFADEIKVGIGTYIQMLNKVL